MTSVSDVGVIGLAVMGKNLILNMLDHGISVSCFNRTTSKVDEFLETLDEDTSIVGCHTLHSFVNSIKRPRKIFLLVASGKAVDMFLYALCTILDKGDVIIDCGNSHYLDTQKRIQTASLSDIMFVGCGISGGEYGARFGPSIMPGGPQKAWPLIENTLKTIAADVNGFPCCEWIGKDGAGHYVKMVHNGIEYGDMQLICEAYDIMRNILHMSTHEIAETFDKWNDGGLNSYLIEITRDILKVDDTDRAPLIDKILDVAEQKNTGKWSVMSAYANGSPSTILGESVFARLVSSMKEERTKLSDFYKLKRKRLSINKASVIDAIQSGLYASKIVNYAQGFMLMADESKVFDWNLDLSSIAKIWMGGCIIRSRFLNDISTAFSNDSKMGNIMFSEFFKSALIKNLDRWRMACAIAMEGGVAIPAMSSALSFFHGMTSETLPANLIQAQRDYFGSHMYRRKDKPVEELFHTQWTGDIY